MKDIKEILKYKTVNNLLDICRKYNLRGYSSLKKDGLINLIAENLNNPQVQESIRSIIRNNETTGLILKNLLDNKNEVSYEKLRENILKYKTGTPFRFYFRLLLENYILYENDLSDDDLIFLPKEFNLIAKNIIDKHIQDEIAEEVEVEEEKEFKDITSLNQIFYSKKYTSIESLKDLLSKLELSVGGNKTQLIDKLFQQSKMPIKDMVDFLFGKNELKDLSRDLKLPVSGNKTQLIENILDKFSLTQEPQEKIAVKEPALASFKAQKINEIESIKKEPTEKSLKDIFYELLSKITYNISRIKDSDSLSFLISSLIRTEVSRFNLEGIDIIDGKKSSVNPSILIVKGEETVAVSIWYFEIPSKKKIDELKARLYDYNKRYNKNVILYIYDHNNKISPDDYENFKADSLLIYKKAKDFE